MWPASAEVEATGSSSRRLAHKASLPQVVYNDAANDHAGRVKAYQDKQKAIAKKRADEQRRQDYFAREQAQAEAARATQERLEAAARDRARKMAQMEAEMQAVKMRMKSRDANWATEVKQEAERAEAERLEQERREQERLEAEKQFEEERRRLAKLAREEAARRKVEMEAAALRAAELEKQRWDEKEAAAQQGFKPQKKGAFHRTEGSIPEGEEVDFNDESATSREDAAAQLSAELAAVKQAFQACENACKRSRRSQRRRRSCARRSRSSRSSNLASSGSPPCSASQSCMISLSARTARCKWQARARASYRAAVAAAARARGAPRWSGRGEPPAGRRGQPILLVGTIGVLRKPGLSGSMPMLADLHTMNTIRDPARTARAQTSKSRSLLESLRTRSLTLLWQESLVVRRPSIQTEICMDD